MSNFEAIQYDVARAWINRKRQNKVDWNLLLLACKSSEEELLRFLQNQKEDNDWPDISIDDWKEIVKLQKESEEMTIRIDRENGAATIHDAGQDNNLTTPTAKETSWQCYRRKLIAKGFKQSTVEEIERATLRTIRRLSLNTERDNPIKGMVIGNVQSGKTANMAALMAMAADWGWNMFIIMSGSIENLRKQTQSRLYEDLNSSESRILWRSLEHLKKPMSIGMRAQDLHFEGGSNERFMTVCLKNKARLKNLIKWMQDDSNSQNQMKVLVIDDEADQAGINTADVTRAERRAINQLICNLVNGKNESGDIPRGQYKAMNYIGYTATPYANVLNEASPESLYPRSFISTLSVSKEYFGPQQIFGADDSGYDGMDIVREISTNDLNDIRETHNGNPQLPSSLKDAICWFMCGVACMRLWGYKSPISMLVHTSQKTDHHKYVSEAIYDWIKHESADNLITRCQSIWNYETGQFSLVKFREQYPDYDRPDCEINQYPSYGEIEQELRILLSEQRISNIPLDQEMRPEYHDGIHLCVDNCRNNGVLDDMIVRLVYPEKANMPEPAPAFIVVGGATLSRGLTLEGLISTYFVRSVKQSDTLMQMGRWFGYRKNYELIPRIWLSERTERQFEFLASLDQKLRDEIYRMDSFGESPAKYGPRVQNTPQLSFIRIVARNRMQSAVPADLDFSGMASQTYVFDNDKDKLSSNIETTKQLLLSLGKPTANNPVNKHAEHSVIWRGVDFSIIAQYLKDYKYCGRQSVFNDIDPMIQWIEEVTQNDALDKWNIVLAGVEPKNGSTRWTISDDVSVVKVIRTQKTKNRVKGILNLGALRVPKDILTDIDLAAHPELANDVKHFQSRHAMELRDKAGLGRTPQLLIYIVDKDSKAKPGSVSRVDLEAVEDIVGFSINIPGETARSNNVASIHIVPPQDDTFDETSDIEGNDED